MSFVRTHEVASRLMLQAQIHFQKLTFLEFKKIQWVQMGSNVPQFVKQMPKWAQNLGAMGSTLNGLGPQMSPVYLTACTNLTAAYCKL